MTWRKLQYLFPWRRRAEERAMREELDTLAGMAGPGELGNLTLAAENARQTWHFTSFDGVAADVRYAFRTLRAQPGFVAVAVLSLALGIGVNSAMFSFSDALLLRPLPVARPAEVLSISNSTPENPIERISYPDYRDLRQKNRSFSGMVAYRTTNLGVAAAPAALSHMRLAAMVSDNFFDVLGIAPSLGRTFLSEEAKHPGRDPVAILGYDFWNTQYGRDRGVIGRTIRLNGVVFTVVGVAPESFPGMDLYYRPALYVPLAIWEPLEDRGRHDLTVKGRLGSGASLDSARAEMAALGRNLESEYPKTNQNRHVAVRTETDARIQQVPARLPLVTMLMGLAGLVLVIACANVASLMLARARARSREIAIRVAIGAGRLRLVRQMLTESLLVALASGAAGLGVAYAVMRYLETLEVTSDIPIVLGLTLDARVLAFNLAAAMASCILFGLAPALQAARTEPVSALKGQAISVRRRTLGRNLLVVGQISLAMVLLMIAGMFLGGVRQLLEMNPGFRTDHLIGMELDPSLLRYSPDSTHDFYRKLRDRVRALPGVRSVAMAEVLPYAPSQPSVTVIPEGHAFLKHRKKLTMFGGAFDENYFAAMKIDILRGRAFTADDRAASRAVAIVNDEFVRTWWPNQDAIGMRIRLEGAGVTTAEVVGVARTARYLFPTERPRPYVYLPYEQNRRSRMTLVTESYGDPAALAAPLRDLVRGMDADQPVFNLRTLASNEARAVNNWLIFVEIFAAMGILGLILATVGLYGLISYSVSRRTAEIGVRMAIGASRADVLRLVLRQGLTLAAVGIVIGGTVAALLMPAVSKTTLGSGTASAAASVAVPFALLLVSLAASYVPARRAARLDPMRALRCD